MQAAGSRGDEPFVALAPPRALICDCDGTLVDTDRPYLDALNMAIAASYTGVGFAPGVSDEVWGRDLAGRGLEADAQYAVRKFDLGCDPGRFLELWKAKFSECVSEAGSVPLLDGFDELYQHVRGCGIRFAVASSSDGAGLRQKLLSGVVSNSLLVSGLDDFDVVVSNDDVTRHKPDPEIYLLAARLLGLRPDLCWVLEDTEPGVAAGKSAGMRVAAVPNRYTRTSHDFSEADVVLGSMRDLVDLL